MAGPGKGNNFEREICKRLSLWWTNGDDDGVFWRTAGSGGRARRRGRADKRTEGQHGDMTALDPIGSPLISLLTIEMKKGYGKFTLMDLIDKPKKGKEQVYETWFRKCIESQKQAGTPYWALIHKRDRREALIFFPADFYRELFNTKGTVLEILLTASVMVNGKKRIVKAMTLDYFLSRIRSFHIIKVLENCSKN